MKAFRTYAAAKVHAKGLPILAIGSHGKHLYVAFDHCQDMLDVSEEEVTLIRPDGQFCGHLSMRHLDRLGDANTARAGTGPAGEQCLSRHDLGLPEQRPSMIRVSPNVVRRA